MQTTNLRPNLFTIEQAKNHPDRGQLALDDLRLDVPLSTLVKRFAWAVGVREGDALFSACVVDVEGDGHLAIALHETPSEFGRWLRRDDASIYELTEATDGEDWQREAADRLAGVSEWPEFTAG